VKAASKPRPFAVAGFCRSGASGKRFIAGSACLRGLSRRSGNGMGLHGSGRYQTSDGPGSARSRRGNLHPGVV
jgi:hypothetical protein